MNERPSARTGGQGRRAAASPQIDYAEYQTSSPRAVETRGRSWAEHVSDGTAAEPAERTGPPGYMRGLGWLSIGLGLAGLLAPGRLARLTGRFDTRGHRRALRLIGTRELLTGLALVTTRRPNRWLWSRVVGDAIDIGLAFGTSGRSRGLSPRRQSMTLAALGAVTAVDLMTSYRTLRNTSGAPSAQREGHGEGTDRKKTAPFRASITINRPPALVYTFWRRLENLPRFMTYLDSIQVIDERRSHWKAVAAGGAIEWDAEITHDVPNRVIAWESAALSTGGPARVAHSGRVQFTEAPGNRGTEVRLEMTVALPGGAPARAAARLLRRVPEQIALNDLHRLKQLIETGSIARSDASLHAAPHPAQPAAPSAPAAPRSTPSSAASAQQETVTAVSTAAGDPTITGERP